MVVPDTSIWIEFLKQNLKITTRFVPLLEARDIAVIEPVFSELLYGIRKAKDKELVLSYWNILPKLEFESGSMLLAAQFANKNNYHNLGIGLMDALILRPIITKGYKIWTLDKRILKILDKSTRFN